MYFQMAEKEKTQKYVENQQKQKEKSVRICTIPTDFGLSDKTWTCGLYHPKVARYQLRHTQMSRLVKDFDIIS